MKITAEDVAKVAALARLRLDEEERDRMTVQLNDILAYMDKLSEVDTSGVAPTTHPHATANRFREDEIRPSVSRESALANGPETNGESFVVPKIIT